MLGCAVRATVEDSLGFHAMAYNSAGTMSTGGRQRVDGTFETVKYVCLATHTHFKTFVIRVATHFACYFPVRPHQPRIFVFIHYLPLSCYFFSPVRWCFLTAITLFIHGQISRLRCVWIWLGSKAVTDPMNRRRA